VDGKGSPLLNMVAAVVPEPPLRNRVDLHRTAVTGIDGRFSMIVGRGKFKVFANEGADAKAWENPAILSAYESRGKPVQIGSEASVNVELSINP